jgi:beta-N-acetylglucosaminidase/uncharacterized protein YraI
MPYLITMGTLCTVFAFLPAAVPENAHASDAGVSTVSRITSYPSDPNFYEVRDGFLYHVIGTPDQRVASFYVGPAPSFLKPGAIYVRDANHNFYERDPDGDHLLSAYTPPYEALDLRLPASIQASDIDNFIRENSPASPLIGLGQTFLEAQAKYGVNAQYLASHAILESGWGLSSIARDKHNLFGYMAFDDDPYGHAAYFPSFKDAIFYQAYFVATQYLNAGGVWYGGSPTLDGMNVHYASDPYWAEKISGIMDRMHPYDGNEYIGKSPLQVSGPPPQRPVTEPIDTTLRTTFPPGTHGVTTGDVNFRPLPTTSSDPYGILKAGTKLQLVGIGADNWYKVIVNNRTGWVYGDYIQLETGQNVDGQQPAQGDQASGGSSSGSPDGSSRPAPQDGKKVTPFPPNTRGVTTDAVNFRAQPSTQADTYGVLQPGTPLQLLSKGADNWYLVKVNDRTGWVYGDYVQPIANPGTNPAAANPPSSAPGSTKDPSSSEDLSSAVTITVNGKVQTYNPAPRIMNGRTLVPMRAIFETLGAKVVWEEKTRTAIASKGAVTIRLSLDSNLAVKNGQTIPLEVKPEIVDGRMMVPARFVSEALGAKVEWDNQSRTVKINL